MTQGALSIELPVRPESARRARETVAEFRGQLDGPTYNDLRLVVSELVADAVRAEADGTHAVRVLIEIRDRRIRASVIEGAVAYELKSRRPQLAEPGWGIHLARVLGQRWGSTHDAERGSVWVEMDLSDNPLPSPSLEVGKAYAAARTHASRGEIPSNHWEIAHQGFGNGWYRLGMREGPTPADALRSWVDEEGGSVPPGAYGVRSPHEIAWRPFRVDQSSTIHPIDSSAEDDLNGAERSVWAGTRFSLAREAEGRSLSREKRNFPRHQWSRYGRPGGAGDRGPLRTLARAPIAVAARLRLSVLHPAEWSR